MNKHKLFSIKDELQRKLILMCMLLLGVNNQSTYYLFINAADVFA